MTTPKKLYLPPSWAEMSEMTGLSVQALRTAYNNAMKKVKAGLVKHYGNNVNFDDIWPLSQERVEDHEYV